MAFSLLDGKVIDGDRTIFLTTRKVEFQFQLDPDVNVGVVMDLEVTI